MQLALTCRLTRESPAIPATVTIDVFGSDGNGKLRREKQERLRELAGRHSGEVSLICSHDPVLLDRAQAGQ